jgi:hypothetical protein
MRGFPVDMFRAVPSERLAHAASRRAGTAECNLYSITKSQDAIRRLFGVTRDRAATCRRRRASSPDRLAPVVRTDRDVVSSRDNSFRTGAVGTQRNSHRLRAEAVVAPAARGVDVGPRRQGPLPTRLFQTHRRTTWPEDHEQHRREIAMWGTHRAAAARAGAERSLRVARERRSGRRRKIQPRKPQHRPAKVRRSVPHRSQRDAVRRNSRKVGGAPSLRSLPLP